MKYDAKDDMLKPTDTLKNGESVILNSIASNTREWKNNWEAVWDNIQLRAKYKKQLADYANDSGKKELMEARFVTRANEKFHMISQDVMEEVGTIDPDMVFERWDEWVQNKMKGM